MRRSFATAWVQFLRRLLPARLTTRYRPELHYMRGPGPKSRGREPGVDGKAMAANRQGADKRLIRD